MADDEDYEPEGLGGGDDNEDEPDGDIDLDQQEEEGEGGQMEVLPSSENVHPPKKKIKRRKSAAAKAAAKKKLHQKRNNKKSQYYKASKSALSNSMKGLCEKNPLKAEELDERKKWTHNDIVNDEGSSSEVSSNLPKCRTKGEYLRRRRLLVKKKNEETEKESDDGKSNEEVEDASNDPDYELGDSDGEKKKTVRRAKLKARQRMKETAEPKNSAESKTLKKDEKLPSKLRSIESKLKSPPNMINARLGCARSPPFISMPPRRIPSAALLHPQTSKSPPQEIPGKNMILVSYGKRKIVCPTVARFSSSFSSNPPEESQDMSNIRFAPRDLFRKSFVSKTCVVPNCIFKARGSETMWKSYVHMKFLNYYRIPYEPGLRKIWLDNLKINLGAKIEAFVCSHHFGRADFLGGKLKNTAVPTAKLGTTDVENTVFEKNEGDRQVIEEGKVEEMGLSLSSMRCRNNDGHISADEEELSNKQASPPPRSKKRRKFRSQRQIMLKSSREKSVEECVKDVVESLVEAVSPEDLKKTQSCSSQSEAAVNVALPPELSLAQDEEEIENESRIEDNGRLSPPKLSKMNTLNELEENESKAYFRTRKKKALFCPKEAVPTSNCKKCKCKVVFHMIPYHARNHDSRSPWTCKFCGEAFHIKQLLIKHLRTHHRISNEFDLGIECAVTNTGLKEITKSAIQAFFSTDDSVIDGIFSENCYPFIF